MSLSFGADSSGKAVVVTGAGGVLCGMFTRTIAEAEAKVAVLDLSEEAARKVADEIVTVGGTAKAYKTNVLERASLEETHARVLAELGPCDISINGAGGNGARADITEEYFEIGDIEMGTVPLFDLDQSGAGFVFNLNFTGTLPPTQIFAKDIVKREGYTILNISSMNTFILLTKIPTYSEARAAISDLIRQLAIHFSKAGICVNATTPGFSVIKQNGKLLFNGDDTPTEGIAKILTATPMERFGEAGELDRTLLYLPNNEASDFVTGVVIPVDGGFSAYLEV